MPRIRPEMVAWQSLYYEPMGFVYSDDTEATISFNDGTRLFSLTPTGGDYWAWVRGQRLTLTGAKTVTVPATEGLWYIYLDTDGLLKATMTPFNFLQQCPVAIVRWDNTNSRALLISDERHGVMMDAATHQYLHNTVRTRYASGLGLAGSVVGDGSADAHAQVAISDGVVEDEDLLVSIADGAAGRYKQDLTPAAYIPIFYLDGATPVWRRVNATTFPVYQGTSRIRYNLDTVGTWSQPDVPVNGHYVAMFLFATNNRFTPNDGVAWEEPIIAVLGQRTDTTIGNARNNNTLEGLTLPSELLTEAKPIYRLIFQTSTAYGNTPHARLRDILDYRSVSTVPGTYLATVHNALAGRETYPAHPASAISDLADLDNEYWVDKNGSDSNPGTIASPFLTIGAACTAIGNAASAADFNDATMRSYIVHIGTGTYVENVTMPVRPNVTFVFATNAVIQGDLTTTWQASYITTYDRMPKQIFTGVDQRGGINGFGCLTGILGNITVNVDGSSKFYAIQFHSIGIVGNIIWQMRGGGATGAVGQQFMFNATMDGITSATTDLYSCTIWAYGLPRNPDVSDPDGIGGISGKVSFGFLDCVTVNGNVSGTGNIDGFIHNTQWKTGLTVDFSTYVGKIAFDIGSWYELNLKYPAHGLPQANLQFTDFNLPYNRKAVTSADYTILDQDYFTDIDFTTGAGDRVCTLPALSTVINQGRIIRVTKVDAAATKVTVTCAGADTFVDGSTTTILNLKGDTVGMIGTVAGWKIINRPCFGLNDPLTGLADGAKHSMPVGETVAFGDLLYLNADGEWYKADANAAATMPGLRMALEAKNDGEMCSMLLFGVATLSSWTWTVGGLLYASAAAAGAMVQTAPAGTGDQVQVLGVAIAATKVQFTPSPVLVEVA